MKIFISWSGEKSKNLANAIYEWLPIMLNGIEPWISTENIGPSDTWFNSVSEGIKNADVAILCITKENCKSPWLMFEAGAVWKGINNRSRLIPLMLDISVNELADPFKQFQSISIKKDDIKNLILSLTSLVVKDSKLLKTRIEWVNRNFELYYPNFQSMILKLLENYKIRITKYDKDSFASHIQPFEGNAGFEELLTLYNANLEVLEKEGGIPLIDLSNYKALDVDAGKWLNPKPLKMKDFLGRHIAFLNGSPSPKGLYDEPNKLADVVKGLVDLYNNSSSSDMISSSNIESNNEDLDCIIRLKVIFIMNKTQHTFLGNFYSNIHIKLLEIKERILNAALPNEYRQAIQLYMQNSWIYNYTNKTFLIEDENIKQQNINENDYLVITCTKDEKIVNEIITSYIDKISANQNLQKSWGGKFAL